MMPFLKGIVGKETSDLRDNLGLFYTNKLNVYCKEELGQSKMRLFMKRLNKLDMRENIVNDKWMVRIR